MTLAVSEMPAAVSEAAAAPLTLTLFGPMQVLVHGQPLPRLRSRKSQWLLALLVLRHGRAVEREWLAGTLWPDTDPSQAFDSLRTVLSELRKALGTESERLVSPTRHTLQLDLAHTVVDVPAFDKAIASKKIPALEQAVTLYRGSLLEGCSEEWVAQERGAREQDCLRALGTLAEAALNAGEYGAAAGYSRRAVSLDPWREAARRGLMEALARGGDRNAALQVYREFTDLLRSDPRAVPDEETRTLYSRLRAEARRQAAAPSHHSLSEESPGVVLPVVTGYLPHSLSDLIGREDERLEVAARLRRSRLVTLAGPGGIGKTRLAVQVAAEIASEFADGVWLVALESLTEEAQVIRQIAGVLNVKEESGRSLLESLSDRLRSKRLLLVLDNCEHLLEASAQTVGFLLRECAGVRVLTTSREALGITGEAAWRVPSLATPDPAHLPKEQVTLLRVLLGYESVQLFIERVQAVRSDFSLTRSNAPAVAQVCARLEGIPLAIELAAAQVRVLTVEQVAARFDSHLGLLAGGSRMAQARQQTLRATLDWSYSLLNHFERLLLGRLSVFSGGWRLEAAEVVCAGNGIGTGQVLDLLAALVDKSLVVFEERDADTGGRYRFLEMVRQFAAEHLEAGGKAELIKARQRDFFLALAEQAEPHLKGPEQGLWLRRLEAEIDNLRAALAWCGAEKDEAEKDGAAAGLRMTCALWQFWELRGYYNEGRAFLSAALGRAEDSRAENSREEAGTQTNERATALYASGVLAFYQGDFGPARTLYEEGLTLFRELGNKQGTAGSLKDLGRLAGAQGDYGAARALYEESLAISREMGDLQGSGWSLNDLGNVAGAQGDFKAARALHQESLAISRTLGDTEGIAWSLHHLGGVAGAMSDNGPARAYHEESLAIFRELGNKQGAAWSLNYLAKVVGALGDYETARSLYEECLTIFQELGNKQGIAWSLNDLAKAVAAQGDYGMVRPLQLESLTLFLELGERRGVAASLRELAFLTPQPAERSVRLWGAAEALRESIGARMFQGEQEIFDRQVAQVRADLGEDAFSAAWEAGRVLTIEQAAAYALE